MRTMMTTRRRWPGTDRTAADGGDSGGGDMKKGAETDATPSGTDKTADAGGGDMRKRARIDTAATATATAMNVWKREVGALSTRRFCNRLVASEDLVLRFDVFRKLQKHRGCVNTVSFNAAGDALITGSDDRKVIIWDWESGKVKLSFHSEHQNNIFQAKFMPFSEDQSIVTCAADGQVRHIQILEGGNVESKLLTEHQGRVHKLAIEPGSPHVFYTCGEDGLVKHLDLRRTQVATTLFTCQPRRDRRFLLINPLHAIAINPRNPNLFAIAGGDSFARLYDIRKHKWNGSGGDEPVDFFCPAHLRRSDYNGITGLAFSDQSELLVSYTNEQIYLFSKDMGVEPDQEPPLTLSSDSSGMGEDQHPVSSPRDNEANVAEGPAVFKGHINIDTIKGVNFFGPKCEYVMSGSDCGRIFIWKKKGGELIRVMEADAQVVNSIEAHPHSTVLASCGLETSIKIWTPRAKERAVLPNIAEKVFLPGQVQFLEYDEEYIAYLNGYNSLEGEDENDSYDYGDDDDDNDVDPFDVSMDDGDSDSMDEDEDDEEDEDEEFHDTIVGGDGVVDRSLDDNDDDNNNDDDDVSSDH